MAILTDAQYDADLLIAVEDSPATFTFLEIGDSVPNIQTGVVVPDETEYEITGLREQLTAKEIELSKGKYEYGDNRFFIRVPDLIPIPENRDQIRDGGAIFQFVECKLDPTQRLWIIIGRKQA